MKMSEQKSLISSVTIEFEEVYWRLQFQLYIFINLPNLIPENG